MSETSATHLPPDGQSEQVSFDEPRDGGAEEVGDIADREISRESPDGTDNPVEEPVTAGDNEEETVPTTAEAEEMEVAKEEADIAIDDNNNVPVGNTEGTEINDGAEAMQEDADRGEEDNQGDGKEDDDVDLPQAEESHNQNDDVENDVEKIPSDAEAPTKPTSAPTAPTTAQTLLGNRKLTTTPADDSGLTQPALPVIPRGQAKVQQLATSISNARNQNIPHPVLQPIRSRVPPKLMRLATVTVSPLKARPLVKGPSLYYEEPKRPQKVITWEQANNARPPLRIDMEGPGPCTYSPLNKPLHETNAPCFTFGTKCSPEKPGLGSRTSWAKSWFQSSHLYHQKADYIREGLWPSPNHYPKAPTLGSRTRTMYAAPSYTFGHKQAFSIVKAGAHKEPSPNDYERQIADKHIMRRGPSFSHQFRREGTVLWGHPESTPGPAAYVPLHSARIQNPAYTIQGIRREKSHVLGPYSTI